MWKCASRSLKATLRRGVFKCNTVLSTKALEKKELNCLLKFTPALIERCNRFYNYYRRTSENFTKEKKDREGPKEKTSFVGVDSDFICALKLGGLFALCYAFVQNKFKILNPSISLYEKQPFPTTNGYHKTLGYLIDAVGIKPYNCVIPGVEAARSKNGSQPASEFTSKNLKSDEVNFSDLELAHQKVLGTLTNLLGTQCMQSGQHKEALEYFIQSAEEEHAPGIFNLGICHEKGLGTSQNFKMAAELYQRAADLGHATAMYNLGVFYAQGKGEIQPDLNHARDLFKAAASLGQANAVQALNLEKQTVGEETESDCVSATKEISQFIFDKLLDQPSLNSLGDFRLCVDVVRHDVKTNCDIFEYQKEINSSLGSDSGVLDLSPHSEPCTFLI